MSGNRSKWMVSKVAWCLLILVSPLTQAVENTQAHPLFVYRAPTPAVQSPEAYGQSMVLAWSALSEFFQAHGAISLPQSDAVQSEREAWNTAIFEQLKGTTIPLVLTVADGHTQRFASLEMVEYWLKTYPNIQALHVKQPQWNTTKAHGELTAPTNDPQTAWLTEIIQITKRHQRKLILEMDDLNPHILMSHPQYKPLYEVIAKHHSFITLLYTQGGLQSIPGNSATMGLWMEGAIDQWGISINSGSYAQAGLREPGLFGSTTIPVTPPASLYRAWILNGALTGATTYWFNNADELWAGSTPRYWAQVIAPTLLDITREGYIARKDLVQHNALMAYQIVPATTWAEFAPILNDIDGVFHEGRMIHAAYGMERPGQVPEWIPNSGTHYWIPILSTYASEEIRNAFKEVVSPGVLTTVAAWQERLNIHYTPDGQGTAFIQKVGRAYFVMHTRENAYASQRFQISGIPAPLHNIAATREGTKVTLEWPFREGDISYSIYRLKAPNLNAIHAEDFVEIATGLDARTYADEEIAPGETVLYSVTALTNESSQLEGTVNYGEYKVISSVNSRVDAFALVEPYTMRSRPVNGISQQVSGLPDTQPDWIAPTPDNTEALAASEGIVRTLASFSAAVKSEDIEALIALIHPDYSDDAGTTKALLGSLFQSLFTRYHMGPMGYQVQSWTTNMAPVVSQPTAPLSPEAPIIPSSGVESFDLPVTSPTPTLIASSSSSASITTTAYLRLLARSDEAALVPHPTQTFPTKGTTVFTVTFKQNDKQQWVIEKIAPPLLQVSDLLNQE